MDVLIALLLSIHQMTPLHVAAEGGRVDTVKSLLDNGADSTVMDNNGVSNWNYATDSRLTALSSLSIGTQNMVLVGLYNFLLAEKHHQQFIQCRC